uniref:Uncharacterized protein n=1 Tax=Amphimedon queenslandica TaxID=400682 RepID=A0A1X7VLY4_AMPQE
MVYRSSVVGGLRCLPSETIECTSLPLQSIDDIHSSDCLSLGMLCVSDSITDDILEEDLQYTSCLLIDEARDTLDTTTASKTTNGGLGDSLDVVTKDLPVTLGASLSETFASFSTSRHVVLFLFKRLEQLRVNFNLT